MQKLAGWGAGLLLLPLLVLATGFYLLATEPGSRWLLQLAADRWAGLEVDSVHGSLISGMRFDRLAWRSDGLEVEAHDARLDWSPGCLWSRRICINTLDMDVVQGSSTAGEAGPITLPALDLPVSITVSRLQIRELAWEIRQADGATEPAVGLTDLHLEASVQGDRVQLDLLSLTETDRHWQASGSIAVRPAGALDLQLSADLGLLDVPGIAADGPLVLTMRLGGDWDRTLVDAELDGAFDAHVSGTVSPLMPELPMQLKAVLRAPLQWSDGERDLLLSGASVQVAGDLEQFRFALESGLEPEGHPDGDLVIQGEAGSTGWFRVHRMQYSMAPELGSVKWDGALNGDASELRWNGEIETARLNLNMFEPRLQGRLDARLETSGAWKSKTWSLQSRILEAAGNLQDHALRISGGLDARSDGFLQVRNVRLHSGSASLDVSGTCSPDCDVQASLNAPELGTLLQGLSGSLRGTVAVSGPIAKPDLDLHLTGTGFGLDGYMVREWSAAGSMRELGARMGDFSLEARELVLPASADSAPRSIERLQIAGRGSLKSLDATLELVSADASLRGVLAAVPDSVNPGDWSGALSQLDIASPVVGDWKLERELAWAWHQSEREVQFPGESCLAGARGRVCVAPDARVGPVGSISFTVEDLLTAAWQDRLPEDVVWEDVFSGQGSVHWGAPETAPRLNLSLRGGPGRLELKALPDTDGESRSESLSYASLVWHADLNAESAGTRLRLESAQLGSLQLDLDQRRHAEEISGNLQIAGLNLQMLQPWMNGIEQLQGRLDADVAIGGIATSPTLNGEVRLSSGALTGPVLPVAIRDLQLKAELSGQRAGINGQFHAGELGTENGPKVGKDGWVRVNGNLRWEESPWQASLGMAGQGLVVQSGSHARATLDGSLGLGVEPGSLQVRGRVAVREGSIRLPKNVGGTVEHSADVVLEPPDPQSSEKAPTNWMIDSQLALDLGQQLHFSGLGLDGWLQGALELRSLHAEPEAHGRISVHKGRYRAYGQRLEIRKGELLFTGNLRSPALDIEAVRPLPEVVAGIRVAGHGEEPLVSLFSEPPMPEEEILSWVVLGRPIGESSGQDGSLLASSALLLGLRGGEELTGRVAERFGITQFEVGTVGQGGTTDVFASGYLSPDLFLRYQTGANHPAHALMLRYRLLSKLYLEATSGLENAIDLLYTMEF